LIKVAVGDLSPASLVFLHTGIGALILVPVAAMRGNLGVLRPHWKPMLLYTLVEVAVPWFLLADAERRLSSSFTGLLIATVPLVGAVLAWRTGAADRLDRRRVGILAGSLVANRQDTKPHDLRLDALPEGLESAR